MLELLQARERIGVPELARRLEVGERTVRRYAAMLREMGIPVEAELGRYGAYSLRSGYRLPPMMFTDEESLGLTLGLLAARHLGLAGVAPAVEGALAKLERVMPEALRGRVRPCRRPSPLLPRGPRRPRGAKHSLPSPPPLANRGGCGCATAPGGRGRPSGRWTPTA
jgi:predicted DNA-binding transcriptional regulator YafY